MKHLCKPLLIACLLVALCGLLCLSASAEYFEVDYYDEIAPGVRCGANLECSTREDTVVVTICNVKATATDIVIQSTLSYNGNNYKVSELRLPIMMFFPASTELSLCRKNYGQFMEICSITPRLLQKTVT